MCKVMEDMREQSQQEGIKQGIEQGIKQGLEQGLVNVFLHSIESLVKSMGVFVEQAMTILDIPEANRPKYREMLDRG